MRSVSDREFELKLELTPQQLQRVGINPALEHLTVGQPVTRTLRSIYYDTPDHRLRAQGISLRVRSIGDQWVQTIQSGRTSARNGASHPDDLELVIANAEPDISQIADSKVRRVIRKAVSSSTLEPQFETLVTRTTRKLHSEKGDLELALDEGIVRAGKIEDTLCEAELELKTGSPECLLETAAALFSTEALRFAEGTKADRGYNLVLGRGTASAKPLKARITSLRGDETCAEALALFTEAATDQIVSNRRALLETDDPEAAHQLRIGLRRLRSALKAFRPLSHGSGTRELELHAKKLGQCIGELRNADVLIEGILAPVAGTRKGEPGFADLRSALEDHRASVRNQTRTALDGEQWSKLHLYLALWPRTVEDEAALQAPVRAFAGKCLRTGWKRISKQGASVNDLTIEARHDMRKALKGFRYTSEFFGSLFEADKVQKFVKDLKRLQDIFGYVNDVATATELGAICQRRCGDNPEAQRASGYVLGWHAAEASHAWKGVAREWERLNRRRPFWD